MCFLNFHHFSETKAAVTDPDIQGIQYIDENVDEENNTIDRDEDSTSDVVEDGEKDGEDDPSALHINKVNLSRVLKENERARLRVCVEITHPALKLPVYRTWTGEHLSPPPVEVTPVRPENHLSSTCCYLSVQEKANSITWSRGEFFSCFALFLFQSPMRRIHPLHESPAPVYFYYNVSNIYSLRKYELLLMFLGYPTVYDVIVHLFIFLVYSYSDILFFFPSCLFLQFLLEIMLQQ